MRNGPKLVLVNAAVDAQAVAADSAAMDSVVSHSAMLPFFAHLWISP